jgi:hypothetical protein
MIRWRCPSPSTKLTRPGTPTSPAPGSVATWVLPPTRAAGSSRSSRAASLSVSGLAPAFSSTAGTAAPRRPSSPRPQPAPVSRVGKQPRDASLLSRTAMARGRTQPADHQQAAADSADATRSASPGQTPPKGRPVAGPDATSRAWAPPPARSRRHCCRDEQLERRSGPPLSHMSGPRAPSALTRAPGSSTSTTRPSGSAMTPPTRTSWCGSVGVTCSAVSRGAERRPR